MIFVCAGIVVLSGLIGLTIANRFLSRVKFYKDVCNFCDSLVASLGFEQNTLPKIFSDFSENHQGTFANILQSLSDLKFNKRLPQNEIKCGLLMPEFLSTAEKGELFEFLICLGATDCATQTETIKQFKQKFSYRLGLAQESKNKNAGLATKLSIGIGLVLAIIIY